MLLSYIEIDGKLHRLGLPANMFAQSPVSTAQTTAVSEQTIHPEHLLAPINGVISAWKVKSGEQVEQGQVVAIMEAMKMEVPVQAHQTGVLEILIQQGISCHAEDIIASIQ
jgi:acetyl-CoA/propionyl-CoA carboxylase biotin carboxyl carrier protein